MTEVFVIDPKLIAIIILFVISCLQFVIIIKAGNILRSYSKMLVMKGRITADGTVTLADEDIVPFVKETISLMNELESLLKYVTGYILNHPSTGWFKAYIPQAEAIGEAIIQELAKEEPIPEQPAPEGAANV